MEALEQALQHLATQIDERLKRELAAGGQVRSGKLYNSIATQVVSTTGGFQLQTTALPYAQKVNDARGAAGFINRGLLDFEEEATTLLQQAATDDIQNKFAAMLNQLNG